MTLLLSIFLLGAAYRLRGWGQFLNTESQGDGGTFARRLFWAASVGVVAGALGLNPAMSFIGAFLGMLIPHGSFYEVRSVREAAGIFAIGAARFALAASPAIAPGLITVAALSGAIHIAAYRLGTVALDRQLVKDPLNVSEPLIGAIGYGVLLFILARAVHG